MKKTTIIILIAVSLIFAQPKVSGWDGVAFCVTSYLEANLKDPDSLDIISCSKVAPHEGNYIQRVKYRAKNGFGGFALSNRVFLIKKINGSYKVVTHIKYK